MAMTRTTDRLQILVAALLFSTGGAAVKACALTSWQVASFRSGIAAVAMLLLLPSARRALSPRVLPVSAAYATTMLLYVLANKTTTAANAIFLQSTAPLYVLILSPLLLRERTTRRDLVFMAVLALGMMLFFAGDQPATTLAPNPLLGNILGGLAGLSWALTIMGLRWLGRSSESGGDVSAAAVTAGNILACLIALPMALPVTAARPVDWLLITFLGVFQIAVAYGFLTRGVARVSAIEVSLLLLLEPVLNPVWAFVVHGEQPTAMAALGGAIIVAATAIYTISGRRDEPATSREF
jgi:drug/metabolite transporter (DMT)-like permease